MALDEFSQDDVGESYDDQRAGTSGYKHVPLVDELMSDGFDFGDEEDWLDWGDDDDDDVAASFFEDDAFEGDELSDEDRESMGCEGDLLLRNCLLEHMGLDDPEILGDDDDEMGFSFGIKLKKGVGGKIGGIGRSVKRIHKSKTLKRVSRPVKGVVRHKATAFIAGQAMSFPPAAPYAGAVLVANKVLTAHDSYRKHKTKANKKKHKAARRLIKNTHRAAKKGSIGSKRMLRLMAAQRRKARLAAKLRRPSQKLHRPIPACPVSAVTPTPGYLVTATQTPRVLTGRFSKAS